MWFITILTLSRLSLIYSLPAPTHLLMTRVGPCEDEPQSVISVSELKISTQTYDSSFSGTVNVTEDIKNGWKIKIMAEKCLDIRNRDTCDHFKSFYLVRNGCNDYGDEEEDVYGMLFHYIKPQLQCPIRSGFYEILNYPFFTEDNYVPVHESKISTSVFGYIYQLHGFSWKKRKILCVEAHVQLIYIREHDWVQEKDVNSSTISPFHSKRDDEDNLDSIDK